MGHPRAQRRARTRRRFGRPTRRSAWAAANLISASLTVAEHLRAGTADLGFIDSPAVPAGLHSRVVARDQLVLVAGPDHPFTRRRRPVDARRLADTPLVSREPGSGTREVLAAALRTALGSAFRQADPVLAASTTSGIRGAVHAGAGPAVPGPAATASRGYPDGQIPTARNSMLVTFELVPDGEGTLLTVTEEGMREQGWEAAVLEEYYASHDDGWTRHLATLASYAAQLATR